MESEDEIDLIELSKEYPLFFSSTKELIKERIYPSLKSPKPISEDPQIFLDYDDYILDERISNLEFYSIENKDKNYLKKHFSNDSDTIVTSTDPTSMTSTNIDLHMPKKSPIISKKSQKDRYKSSEIKKAERSPSKLKHKNIDSFYNFNKSISGLHFNENNQLHINKAEKSSNSFNESVVQTSKSTMKNIFNNLPPPKQSLHNGYPLLFDYQPKYPQRQQKLQNGTEKIFYRNGDILIRFANGKEKIHHQNIILTKFKNGDILQEFLDGATAYQYSNTGTIQLTLPDHTSIIQYPNGQREKRNPEGETIVKFSDGVFMKVDANGNWSMVHSKT